MEFSPQAQAEKERILAQYPNRQAACLPLLHLAQKEFGVVTPEVMEYVARIAELPPSRVYGVVTFYTMFNKEPVGKYLVQVCMNICCCLRGAEEMFDYLSHKLGIKEGETTPDGLFTLMKVECLGACGNAPVIQINDDYYENLTHSRVDAIFEQLRAEASAGK